MNARNLSPSLLRVVGSLAPAALLALYGCTGVPTKAEKGAREHFSQVRSDFRPGDQAANLPALHAASPLDEFLRYAALRHPSVAAPYYEWAASIERITLARSLPDPVFTVGVDVQRSLEDDIGSTIMALMAGIMTELPGPGKLRTRADLQTEESRGQYARFQNAAVDATLAARGAYYDLYLVNERQRVTERVLALARESGEVARRRAEAGMSTLQDVLQSESEVARLESDLANIEDQRAALAASWKTTLGVPATEPDPPLPASFHVTADESVSTTTLEAVLESSPRLRAMKADLARAEASIAVAYKSRVPDFTLGLEAEMPREAAGSGFSARETTYKPRVGFSIPLWRDRIAAEIAEAESMKLASGANLEAAQLDLAREYALNSFGIKETTRNLQVLRTTLLPRQIEIVELAKRAYQGGVATFFELAEQQRRLLELELMEAEGVAERERMIGELNSALLGRAPFASSGSQSGSSQ